MPSHSAERQRMVVDVKQTREKRESAAKKSAPELQIETPNETRSKREALEAKRLEAAQAHYDEVAKMFGKTKGSDVAKRLDARQQVIVADVVKSQTKDVEKALHERMGITAFAESLDRVQTDVLRSYLDGIDAVDAAHAKMTADKTEESKAMWRQAKESLKSIEKELAAEDVDISAVDLGRKANRDALRTEKLSLLNIGPEEAQALKDFATISRRMEQLNKDQREVARMLKANKDVPKHGSTTTELNQIDDYLATAQKKGRLMLEERTERLKDLGIEPSQYNLGTSKGLEAMFLEIPGTEPDAKFLKKDFPYSKTLARLREEKEPIALEGHRDLERTGIQIIDERYPTGNVPRGQELEGYDIPTDLRAKADRDSALGREIGQEIQRVENAPDHPLAPVQRNERKHVLQRERGGMSGETTFPRVQEKAREPEDDEQPDLSFWRFLKESPVAKKVGRYAAVILTGLGLAKGVDQMRQHEDTQTKRDQVVHHEPTAISRPTVESRQSEAVIIAPESEKPVMKTQKEEVTPKLRRSAPEKEAYPGEAGDITIENARSWDIESILTPNNMSESQAKELVKGDPKKLEAALKMWEGIYQGKTEYKKMKAEEQKAILESALSDIEMLRKAFNPKYNLGVETSRRIDAEKKLDIARDNLERLRVIHDLKIASETSPWEQTEEPIDLNVSSK